MDRQAFLTCPNCGREFTPAERSQAGSNPGSLAQMKYCSDPCARQAENKRHYQRHREKIIARNLKNQRKKGVP